MRQKLILLFLLLLLPGILTGCWSRKELSDIAIVMGIGIDKAGDQYVISTQLVNADQVGDKAQGGEAPVITLTVKANTLFEGIRKLTKITPRKLYFAHIRTLVVSESIAKAGVRHVLDYFFRDHEFRPDFYVAVARNAKAADIMKTFSPFEKIPSTKLFKSLEVSEKFWAPTVAVHLNQFILAMMREGKEPVLTGLEIRGNVKRGQSGENAQLIAPLSELSYSTIGVFKEDKLIGWLTEDQSKGYNYIVDNVFNTVHALPCEKGGNVVIELMQNKTNMKGKLLNGRPEIEVSVVAEANVGEVACSIDLSNAKSIADLERKAERQIKDYIDKAVLVAQKKYKSDIFGFGYTIRAADPAGWERLKSNWEDKFPTVKVHSKIDVKLRRTGKVENFFAEEIEKK